jgi:hypothetical protein
VKNDSRHVMSAIRPLKFRRGRHLIPSDKVISHARNCSSETLRGGKVNGGIETGPFCPHEHSKNETEISILFEYGSGYLGHEIKDGRSPAPQSTHRYTELIVFAIASDFGPFLHSDQRSIVVLYTPSF